MLCQSEAGESPAAADYVPAVDGFTVSVAKGVAPCDPVEGSAFNLEALQV